MHIGVGLLFWVAAALLVKGMLLIAGLLFLALVITVALWLRKTLLALGLEGRRVDVATSQAVRRGTW